jgi:hypothetical protein
MDINQKSFEHSKTKGVWGILISCIKRSSFLFLVYLESGVWVDVCLDMRMKLAWERG